MTVTQQKDIAELVADILRSRVLAGIDVIVNEIFKENDTKIGVTMLENGKKMQAVPVFYPAEIMKDTGMSPEEIADYMLDFVKEKADSGKTMESRILEIASKKESILENVQPHVLSENISEEYLKGKVHRKYLDMIIMPSLSTPYGEDGAEGVVRITKGILNTRGITEDEIFEAADRNFRKENENTKPDGIFPPMKLLRPARMSTAGYFLKAADLLVSILKKDTVIIPSSIHELIIYPMEPAAADPESIRTMIHEVNSQPDMLKSQEILGWNPYILYEKSGTVEIFK